MPIPIDTWRWLSGPEGQGAIACAPRSPTAGEVSRLRREHDAERVRGLLCVAEARARARGKLDPGWVSGLLADREGVEMASSSVSSVHKGERFRRVLGEGALVADLCCGIGADSWGLWRSGLRVTGVDSDPARVVMYRHNLPRCVGVCGDALADCPGDIAAFHLDPARRAGGRRLRSMESFEPGPGVWEALIARHGSGAIKLNPGVDAGALPGGELEILSERGGLTQAVLWLGRLAGDRPRRATVLGEGEACSISGDPERPDERSGIGGYLGTLDPCVERAELVGELLRELGVRLVHPGTGLVTGESAPAHAMVRWYRVLEVLRYSEKRVRGVLRGLGAGVVEVRTRGGVVEPDALQRRLRGRGDRDDLGVLVYRLGDRVVAVVAERVEGQAGAVALKGEEGVVDA